MEQEPRKSNQVLDREDVEIGLELKYAGTLEVVQVGVKTKAAHWRRRGEGGLKPGKDFIRKEAVPSRPRRNSVLAWEAKGGSGGRNPFWHPPKDGKGQIPIKIVRHGVTKPARHGRHG